MAEAAVMPPAAFPREKSFAPLSSLMVPAAHGRTG
jgi:hypothetical protein